MKRFFLGGLLALLMVLLVMCSKRTEEEPFDEELDAFLKEWDLAFYYQNTCRKVNDAVKVSVTFGEPFKITEVDISDKAIAKMSTCGLLETMLISRLVSVLGPWMGGSQLYVPGITIFNSTLQSHPVALEFFSRSDCFPVMASRFLIFIKEGPTYPPTQLPNFAMIAASDISMELLSRNEKVQLMAIAVKTLEKWISVLWVSGRNELGQLMIAIMQSCHYAPFMEDVGARLFETTYGYSFYLQDGIYYEGLESPPHLDIILEYAMQFLNENPSI